MMDCTVATAGEPLRRAEIESPALSWTPAGGDCLDEGGSYLWFVRAETDTGPGEWSQGRRFEVDLDSGVLAEAVRRELAEQYITDPTRSLSEISFLLGFSEQSSFSRAFRRWTGQAPTEARETFP